jgi:ubiquinone/menaquinone biosynthesis C-methylase UbiE
VDKTAKTIEAYNDTAESFAERFMDLKLYRKNLAHFIDFLSPGSSVLDLGCGPGNIARLLVDSKREFKVCGIDLSAAMVKLAAGNVPEASFRVGDIRWLDKRPGEYDAVVASFCLPHLTDEEAGDLIKNIGYVLKAGGFLYLSCMEGEKSGFEYTSFSPDRELFFNYYSESFVRKMLHHGGLKVIDFIRQEYPEPGGGMTMEMIFIAQKERVATG